MLSNRSGQLEGALEALVDLTVLSMSYPWFRAAMLITICAASLLAASDILFVFIKRASSPSIRPEAVQEHPLYAAARRDPVVMTAVLQELQTQDMHALLQFEKRVRRLDNWRIGCRIFGHLGLVYAAALVFWSLSSSYLGLNVHLA